MTHPRTLIAFNTATASENKIHDDTIASRFGFTGGLVPGVDVFAYLAHAPAKAWGRDWLAGGRMQARFFRPVYDGDEVSVNSETTHDGLALTCMARGEVCATGTAGRVGSPARSRHLPIKTLPKPDSRPKASRESLAVGAVLGVLKERYSRADGLAHLADVRDEPALYDDGRIASPAWLLRRANYVLDHNVRLGPWIHVESQISLHALLEDGEDLEVRAIVLDNAEVKGHLMVTLDVEMLTGDRPVMTCRHMAIYEPRQVREAR